MCTDNTLQKAGRSNFADADAQKVAQQLLDTSKETTTLDVKNLLRDAGFTATQADVSLAMDRLAFQEDWPWDFNGTYRTFYPARDIPDILPSTKLVITSAAPASPPPRPVFTVLPEDGDWQVFAYFDTSPGPKPTIFIKQGVSRNAARNLYAAVYSVAYIDVGASLYNA